MSGIKILASGTYLPEKVIKNDDFTAFIDTSDEWIKTRTGISQRHYSSGEPTWYMSAMASKDAIEKAGISPSDIGIIIHASVSPDYHYPSCACIVQNEIGANGSIALDINAACSGFTYGVDMAKRYLETDRNLKYALIIGSENLTKHVDFSDRASCILFGDGAAAVVIEYFDAFYTSSIGADGEGGKYLSGKSIPPSNYFMTDEDKENAKKYDCKIPEYDNHYLHQNGKEVYKFATRVLPKAVVEAAAKANLDINDIDLFIPHQANTRIIETAASNLGVSMDKFYVVIDKFGNTSSASIPLAFDDAIKQGKIKRGDKICFVGFGAGLTYGAVIFEY